MAFIPGILAALAEVVPELIAVASEGGLAGLASVGADAVESVTLDDLLDVGVDFVEEQATNYAKDFVGGGDNKTGEGEMQTTLSQSMKRKGDGGVQPPAKLRAVDSGIDGAGSPAGSMFGPGSNNPAPNPQADGPGGVGPGGLVGGTGGGGGIVPAHKWDNHSWGSTTTTHSYSGTFFLKDDRAHINDWVQFPWEYIHWWRNPEVMSQARKSRYYRTKHIKIKFKNPSQTYAINSDGSLVTAGQNASAKIFTWLDTDYIAGPTHIPHNWNKRYEFINACQNDGFTSANAAYFSEAVTFDNELIGPRSSWRSVKQVGANAGGEFDFSWKIDQKKGDWRTTNEFTYNQTGTDIWDMSGGLNSAHGSDGAQQGYQDFNRNMEQPEWRLDNWRCKYVHPRKGILAKRFAQIGANIADAQDDVTFEVAGYVGPPIPGVNAKFSDMDNPGEEFRARFGQRTGRMVYAYAQPSVHDGEHNKSRRQNANNFMWKFAGNDVVCHGPIPTLWLAVQNQIGSDFSSLQLQCVQMQFEMEVSFEWSGGFPSNIRPEQSIGSEATGGSWAQPQAMCPVENFLAGRNVVTPFYPIYEKGLKDVGQVADQWRGIQNGEYILPKEIFSFTVKSYEEMRSMDQTQYGTFDDGEVHVMIERNDANNAPVKKH